jgi:hypothetical protein
MAPLIGFSSRCSEHQQRLDGLNGQHRQREREHSEYLRLDLGFTGGRDAGFGHHSRAKRDPSSDDPGHFDVNPFDYIVHHGKPHGHSLGNGLGHDIGLNHDLAYFDAEPHGAAVALSLGHPGTSQRGGIELGFEHLECR